MLLPFFPPWRYVSFILSIRETSLSSFPKAITLRPTRYPYNLMILPFKYFWFSSIPISAKNKVWDIFLESHLITKRKNANFWSYKKIKLWNNLLFWLKGISVTWIKLLRQFPGSFKVEGCFSNEVYHAINVPKSLSSNINACSKNTNERRRGQNR